MHEIPEESTRIANFQVGKIDTFAVAPDSLATLAEIEDTKFMSQRKTGQSRLNVYGGYYWHAGTDKEAPGWCPECPYVASTGADTTTPEWAAAVKVRKAMGMAIDKDKLVEELLHGEGAGSLALGQLVGYRVVLCEQCIRPRPRD